MKNYLSENIKNDTKSAKRKVGSFMGFLRFIGGIVVFFWLMGLLFKVGGAAIHMLLIVAAAIFIFDVIFRRRT